MSPKPAGTPGSDAGKQRSSLLFWVGCASLFLVLLLVAVGVIMMVMLRRNTAQNRAVTRRYVLPAGWRDSLRWQGKLPPEVALLAPPRTDSGNAAAVLRRIEWNQGDRRAMLLLRAHKSDTATERLARQLLRDTLIDRVAAAARMREYHPIGLYAADSMMYDDLFGVRFPGLFSFGALFPGMDALTGRGIVRADRGQVAKAVDDFRAAIGLAAMMYQREPSTSGRWQAARFASDAAEQLQRVARDTATRNAAGRLIAWVKHVRAIERQVWSTVMMTPDTMVTLAADTTMPFPVRATGIRMSVYRSLLMGPWSVYRGPSRESIRMVRSLEHDADPDLAQLALGTDSTLVRIDRVGGWSRLHWYMRTRH